MLGIYYLYYSYIQHGAYFMSVEVLPSLAVYKWKDTNIKVITAGSQPDPVKIRGVCLIAVPQPLSFRFDTIHALFVGIILHGNELKHLIFFTYFFRFILSVIFLPLLLFLYHSFGFSLFIFDLVDHNWFNQSDKKQYVSWLHLSKFPLNKDRPTWCHLLYYFII